jgi:hypothetical protein
MDVVLFVVGKTVVLFALRKHRRQRGGPSGSLASRTTDDGDDAALAAALASRDLWALAILADLMRARRSAFCICTWSWSSSFSSFSSFSSASSSRAGSTSPCVLTRGSGSGGTGGGGDGGGGARFRSMFGNGGSELAGGRHAGSLTSRSDHGSSATMPCAGSESAGDCAGDAGGGGGGGSDCGATAASTGSGSPMRAVDAPPRRGHALHQARHRRNPRLRKPGKEAATLSARRTGDRRKARPARANSGSRGRCGGRSGRRSIG